MGWHSGNSGNTTHAVGLKKPNELGLYDMSGNVYNWCWDFYDANYYIAEPTVTTDRKGPDTGTVRVVRGGSWNRATSNLRSAYRGNSTPNTRYAYFGMRVVRNAD